MRQFKFQAWYGDFHEEDFWQGEVYAKSWEDAENKIKAKDSRIFKVEKLE